jgi:tetratricopeptide (TPR) repeat protein
MSSTVYDTTMLDQARAALRLAEADPGRSFELATTIARRALDEHDLAAAAVAERALGLATLHMSDEGLDAAFQHLRTAIRLGDRAASPQLAAEARMTLAFALTIRGRPHQGLRELDRALPRLTGVARARAQAQRGLILYALDRFDEALTAYRTALPLLRRADDRLWVLRVLTNRGTLHGYRHAFAAGEADLQEATQLAEALGLDAARALAWQNLGWITGVRGDVPAALHYFDLAERQYRTLRTKVGWLLTDRAELLLSVGLISEAREAAVQAVRELEREGRAIVLPEVRLLLARAATLDGDPGDALDQARQAVREFTRQRRTRWATLARYMVLRSRLAGAQRGRVAVPQIEQAATDLAVDRWPIAAMEARLQAAQLAIERGWPGRAQRQLELAGRGRHHGPALLRARAWHGEALRRWTGGNARGAASAIRTALRILDEHRAGLGATDLRANASRHWIELAELGLRMAFASGRAATVFEWAEQGRAAHLLLRPVRPPDDPVLADALAQLRAVTEEVARARNAGRGTARLVQQQVTLEREIRDHLRRRPGDADAAAAGPVSTRTLAGVLGGAALLEFVQLDGMLHAIAVVEGTARMRRLGPMAPIRDLINRVPFALHRLARHRAAAESKAAAIALLGHVAERLDRALLRPFAAELADRPLVVVPTGPLQSLPWSILPSCAGRPVSVSPSATLWYAGRRASGETTGEGAGEGITGGPDEAAGHVVVAAGPRLPGARAEATEVAAIHGAAALTDATATVETVLTALDGAGLVHLAAHGRLHAHNPLFSSLEFADGPLTVYDLERLKRAPRTVILAACDTGRSVVHAGDELLGLSATFLALGTGQVVGTVVPVVDAATMPLMVAFHRRLVRGDPPAAALAGAQLQVAAGDGAELAAAAGFVCMGG